MSDLLNRIESLSPAKRELVLQKLKQQQKPLPDQGDRQQNLPLVPVSRVSSLPLSFAQQRLWFINQLEGENCTFNVPCFWQLDGNLNKTALEQAITAIVQRHEVLRTGFRAVDGAPVQVIEESVQLTLPMLDWRSLSAPEQTRQAQQFATTELQRPFDLAHPPLLRATIAQLGAQSHVLFLVMHHIVCDGWSLEIFRRELLSLYTAFCRGEATSLPQLPLQYADFAHWQRQWLQGEVLQTQLQYWQTQLAGSSPLLELPVDYPRPPAQTYRGRSEFLQLSPALTQQLKRLSQDAGTTLFMTLLTAFTLLLSRYSGREDVVVGSAIANRNRRELEPLIGFFVNTLPLRTNLRGNPSFWDLLQRVKQITLDAYDHQDLPFEKLVDELGSERSLSHHPLFQVVFGLQTETQNTWQASELTVTPFQWENTTTLLDLSLTFRETPQGLLGEWEYAIDLFDSGTIQRMVGSLEMLLQEIVRDPQRSIQTIPLVKEVEQQQVQQWNQTDIHYARPQTLVGLFEQQVEQTPDQLAIVFDSEFDSEFTAQSELSSLTYAQLNHKANQLAHHLRQHYRIQPDTLIGICVERSLELVIGVLGVLKAGGAYVPIDPNYPSDRIEFMLQDTSISVLLTQAALKPSLPLAAIPDTVICLDEELFATASVDNLPSSPQPHHLAYVIYTSGSTGRPKGVMIEHRAIANLALAWANQFQMKPTSRLLQFGSFSFDLSIGEIAAALTTGTCLYLAPSKTLLPGQMLVDFLTKHRITHAFMPASSLSVLPKAPLADLKTIAVGGEALSAELVHQWASERCFFNCYGPTEATVTAVSALCQPDGKKPSIGHPLPNLRIYILNQYQQPVPLGVPGELCIAGVGLARGYLNRPDLTAERFVEVELWGRSERIYKTGDVARWLPDGNLEYLGRLDTQVKLRGFRIELSEIEATLLQYPLVNDAVVLLYEADGNPRLVAYVTASVTPVNSSVQLASKLRDYLKTQLPNYMVPSQIMILDRLPLTTNGKLDQRALPTPDRDPLTQFATTVTPTEELLVTLWQNLLKTQSIGRHDHFFELGGHSLLATQLVARIRDSFGVELPVRQVFEHSILSELAATIDKASTGVALPPIMPQPDDVPKPLSFAQSRLWFLAHLEGAGTSATYNMPMALQLDGSLNLAALRASFVVLVDRHAVLRTYFPEHSGEPQVVVQPVEAIDVLEIADLRGFDRSSQTKIVQQFVDQHAQEPLNLNTGPLFKAKLLQLSEQQHVLLINMHHIISDGWSMGVFKREWQQTYGAIVAGQEPNLPPLPIQYSDYAAWQRSWLQGETLAAQERYWQQQLHGAPQLLELPTDYPRPAVQSYQGANQEYNLSPRLTEQLKTLSQQQGVSLFMVLLSTFSILLSRYSRQNDLCIGSPIANRTYSHTEELIGFFVNTLVLRQRINPEHPFTELLQQTRQMCLEAYSHQDIPFEYLVEKLQPERNLSHNPLFQVMLTLQNQQGVGEQIRLPELEVQWLEQNYPFAKFDLRLDIAEYEGSLHCTWEYATDLFAAPTIARMAQQWELLLETIVAHPQQRIQALPCITAAEIEQLRIWNQTQVKYPLEKTLVDLFEEQVERTPEHTAVVFDNQRLSYQQLNQRVNQLTHYLLDLQTKHDLPDNPLIAIYADRSLEMVIGLLGILKAGGAYVPIDPNYPRDRIQLMLDDSGAAIVLTASIHELPPPVGPQLPYQVVSLAQENFANQLRHNPVRQSQPQDLAYVIYTSGSTGKPKGAMNTHIGIANRILWIQETYQLTPQDCVLQKTPFSFDVSVWEFFWPLIAGATLAIAIPEGHKDPLYLSECIAQHQVTTIHFVPSMLQAFLQGGQVQHCRTLKRVICSGEALSVELQKVFFQEFGSLGTELHNLYGPTETAVEVSFWQCQPQSLDPFVPIGKPIANTHLYVLDAQQNPVPIGVPGELHIGGIQVGRGYLNRPELTAEKFVQVNVLGQPERVYKTGDLVKWLPDGNLHYLGRIDHQVKLRGFRVELGEIEASLLKHPTIQAAVVVVRQDNQLDQRLVAYVVPPSPEDGSRQERVKLWQQVFDHAYDQSHTADDFTLNFASWISSYTGQFYPTTAMQEWRDHTVQQILALAPQQVLEIGCGTGMLLLKVAPHCQQYLGTDIATSGLQYIEQQLDQPEQLLQQQSLRKKVALKQRTAEQFENTEVNVYDLVILNSVIQYFPSIDYLLAVLEGAIAATQPQGKILIGDVRNLRLLKAFHTAVAFYGASDSLAIQELRHQIEKGIRSEGELLIDPDFFIALKQRFPRITQVQIQLKRGFAQTEMNQFRYDVVLYLDEPDRPTAIPEWLDWQTDHLSLAMIERLLTTQQPPLVGIRGVPNARLTTEIALLDQMTQIEGTVADLKAAIPSTTVGIEPEAFHTLIRDLPYTALISYSSNELTSNELTQSAQYDVILQRHLPDQRPLPNLAQFIPQATLPLKSWQHYANRPSLHQTQRVDLDQIEEWRSFLAQNLPNYMIPSQFVVLDDLPLSPSGKVDRKALPTPEPMVESANREAPVTATENKLAELWATLLRYEAIHRQDNFFHLGGHSLLATQLCYRVRDTFQVELPLRQVFEMPTLSELASYLDTCLWINSSSSNSQPLNSDEEEIEL